MLKKMLLIALIAAMAVTGTACSCNGNSADPKTTSAITNSEATEAATEAPTAKKTAQEQKEEKAVKDNKLKIDKNGNIVDKDGKKLEVKDGKVEVKTDDGKTVTVDTDTIKSVNNNNTNGSGNNGGNSSNNTSSKTSNNSSKPNNNTSKPSNNSSKPSNNTSKPNNSSSPTSKPAENNKTWHEAEYEYINHPAKTKQVWVVDKAAYTYEEPIYEEHWRTICNGCGADITDNLEHVFDCLGSYHNEPRQVQVGTKTVEVPEEGHYETQVVEKAWTEKKLVKEAGYY